MADKNIHRFGDPNVAGGLVTNEILQSSVFCNDLLVAVDGSCVTGHPPFVPPHAPTCTPKTANGSRRVFAEDIPINRLDDPDTCTHERAIGSPDCFISGD